MQHYWIDIFSYIRYSVLSLYYAYVDHELIRYFSEMRYLFANYAGDCSREFGYKLQKENVLLTVLVILDSQNMENNRATTLTNGVRGFSWNFLHNPCYGTMEPREVEFQKANNLTFRITPLRNEDRHKAGGI